MTQGHRAARPLLIPALLVAAGAAAYANSLRVPFVFDDIGAILHNPTLARWWPGWAPFHPPAGGTTVTGRPILNASFALNYALGGFQVLGYHLGNLAIHLGAAGALYGLVRQTLRRRACAALTGALAQKGVAGSLAAFAVAWVWLLHPLQTEAVTYVAQRAEALMGLCYLLTLYGLVRAAPPQEGPKDQASSGGWLILSVFACLLGMGTKEVMASAPVLALLYDRTFLAGSFAEAWRRRRGYYACLAATWVPLAWEVLHSQERGGTVGFQIGVSWAGYYLLQGPAILHYLRLTLWPSPLVFDYGTAWPVSSVSAVAAGIIVLAAVAGTGVALRRWPVAGFLGTWFFAVLAVTSLVPGNRQVLAEHRMYLALAPLLALIVLGIIARAGRLALALILVVGVAFGTLSFLRNRDYATGLALWSDTAAKCPSNPYARYNVGEALLDEGEAAEAVAPFQAALQLRPAYPEAHNNLGNAYIALGKIPEAVPEFAEAVRLQPDRPEYRNNLGSSLLSVGRPDEAQIQFREALALDPQFAQAHNNLGQTLLRQGTLPGAVTEFQAAVAIAPDFVEAHNNLGNAWSRTGQLEAAEREFRTAIQLRPASADAHSGLGSLLFRTGRRTDGLTEFGEAARLNPRNAPAHFNFANALAQFRRFPEAAAQYELALRLTPDDPLIHYNFGGVLFLSGRTRQAEAELAEAIRLKPDFTKARTMLSRMQAMDPGGSR